MSSKKFKQFKIIVSYFNFDIQGMKRRKTNLRFGPVRTELIAKDENLLFVDHTDFNKNEN